MDAIIEFGEFYVAPKKGYVSLRCKKQFPMIGLATNTRVDVGINIKLLVANARLIDQPAGSMCNYKVKENQHEDVENELLAWIRRAFDHAG